MDLRCLSVGKRTWLHKLKYKRADWVLIAFSTLLFVGSTAVRIALPSLGRVWVPSFVLAWAGF